MSTMSVFVYGTLRPGGGNFKHWTSEFEPTVIGGELAGHRLHNNRAFPYCVETGDMTDLVYGDILHFSDEMMGDAIRSMDMLEGVPHHYERALVNVTDECGNEFKAWVYRPSQGSLPMVLRLPVIVSGDWFDR